MGLSVRLIYSTTPLWSTMLPLEMGDMDLSVYRQILGIFCDNDKWVAVKAQQT